MMTAPPTLVMPLWRVVPENGISGALPVLATLDVPALLEFYRRSLCGIWLFGNVEVLRLNWLALRCLAPSHGVAPGSCSSGFTRFASGLYLSAFRRGPCLSLNLILVPLSLLVFLSCG